MVDPIDAGLPTAPSIGGTPPGGVQRELLRLKDGKHVGTLHARRCVLTQTRDAAGEMLSRPVPLDALVVTIDARGEQICWVSIPWAELKGEEPA